MENQTNSIKPLTTITGKKIRGKEDVITIAIAEGIKNVFNEMQKSKDIDQRKAERILEDTVMGLANTKYVDVRDMKIFSNYVEAKLEADGDHYFTSLSFHGSNGSASVVVEKYVRTTDAIFIYE